MGRHYACIVNEMSYICMLLFCTFAYRNNVQHSRLMKKIINPYLGKKVTSAFAAVRTIPSVCIYNFGRKATRF